MLQSRSPESESKKGFCRSQSRTEINPGSQSWSWSRTEKMAKSQSRTDFASTLQHWFRFCLNKTIVTLWNFYRSTERGFSLYEFTRQIVIALLASPQMEARRGVRPKTNEQVLNVTRLDRKEYQCSNSGVGSYPGWATRVFAAQLDSGLLAQRGLLRRGCTQ